MSYFVAMKDNFMSGWGRAAGRTNVFVVECDDAQQVEQIRIAAATRPEMKNVRCLKNPPRDSIATLVSRRHFNELGPIWTGVES